VGPSGVELVRLTRTDRRIRLGIVAVAALLLVAVAKPWAGPTALAPADSTSPLEFVAAASTAPSASSVDVASMLCVSPDGWRIVADDTELGRTVRTWLVAAVERSAAPPARSTIPVTTLVSSDVRSLGFCRPAATGGSGAPNWSGTLWLQGPQPTDPIRWQLAATLSPAPGAIGALVRPLNGSSILWQPGLYFLEARFAGSDQETWLGLSIQPASG
jgi:hypothetical protein